MILRIHIKHACPVRMGFSTFHCLPNPAGFCLRSRVEVIFLQYNLRTWFGWMATARSLGSLGWAAGTALFLFLGWAWPGSCSCWGQPPWLVLARLGTTLVVRSRTFRVLAVPHRVRSQTILQSTFGGKESFVLCLLFGAN